MLHLTFQTDLRPVYLCVNYLFCARVSHVDVGYTSSFNLLWIKR